MNMRALAFAVVLGLAALGAASAQQRMQPIRPPGLQVQPNATLSETSATSGNCSISPFAATITLYALAVLPETDATHVAFEIREGDTVRATGRAPIVRILRPDGDRTGPPVAEVRTSFDVSGASGLGAVRVRLTGGARGESAPIAYSWACATLAPMAPGVAALPDLAFDQNYLAVHMWRDGDGMSAVYRVAPGQDAVFWDTTVCRGENRGWSPVNLRVIALNLGAADAGPESFEIETRVAGAPALDETSLHLVAARMRRHIEDHVSRARQRSGLQDTIWRTSLISAYFLNLPRTPARPVNRLDVSLPCGQDRTIELILDPDNVVRESNEDNNRLTIRYDMMG